MIYIYKLPIKLLGKNNYKNLYWIYFQPMFKLKYYYYASLPYKYSLSLPQDSSNLIIKGQFLIIQYEDAKDVKVIFLKLF